MTDLSDATRIYLPRCYFGDVMEQSDSLTLIGFCDALPEPMQRSSTSR